MRLLKDKRGIGNLSSSQLSSLGIRWNCRTVLFVSLSIWVIGFIIFFLHFHADNKNAIPPRFLDQQMRNEFMKDIAKNPLNQLRNRIKNNPIMEERMMMSGISDSPESKQLFKIAQIMNKQTNIPKEQRRLYDDIQLADLSQYAQPREIYDIVKTQFKNAKWQPE